MMMMMISSYLPVLQDVVHQPGDSAGLHSVPSQPGQPPTQLTQHVPELADPLLHRILPLRTRLLTQPADLTELIQRALHTDL